MFRKGDIVFVQFPFSDLSHAKRRPALILSAERVGQSREYILVQITSKGHWTDGRSIPITPKDYRGKPLKLPSYIRFNKIFTANESLILSRETAVTQAFRLEVVRAINRIIK